MRTPRVKPQQQEAPGREAEMSPRPDHGEETARPAGRDRALLVFLASDDSRYDTGDILAPTGSDTTR